MSVMRPNLQTKFTGRRNGAWHVDIGEFITCRTLLIA